MVAKQYWKCLSNKFLDLHREAVGIESAEIHGYSFDVFPGVFSPAISSDTSWFAQKLLPIIRGKSLLEIGTGTGVIACLAKLGGATKVVATDINSTAVKNAKHNAKKHKVDVSIFQGDMYSPVKPREKFDVIFWNHPFNYTENQMDQQDALSLSVFDLQYTSLKKYFFQGKAFLTPGGQLLLGTGSIARINKIKKISANAGFSAFLICKEVVGLSQFHKTKMDIRIYGFFPKSINIQ